MTVRLIPTESDSTPTPQDLVPPRSSDGSPSGSASTSAATSGAASTAAADDPPIRPEAGTGGLAASPSSDPMEQAEPDEPGHQVDPGSPGHQVHPGSPGDHDSRIALREARRQRRRTAWLCAAVVALCLALTIVVVSLARTRPAPSSGTLSAPSAVSTPVSGSLLSADPHLGAPASEGGNP